MKRKVIQLNPTTLAVTLPKKWTMKNTVVKGDELQCIEQGSGISFDKKIGSSARIAKIDFNKQFFEKNHISSLYQAGIDEIEISYSDPKIIPIIKEHISKYLIGFDVVEEKKKSLIIKSITTDILIDFPTLYRKNMQIMCQMMVEIEQATHTKDFTTLSATRALEEHENKIQSLCLRFISKKGFPENPLAEKAAYDLIREIENICDCMKRICDELSKKNTIITTPTKEYITEVRKFVESFYTLYFSESKDTGEAFLQDGKKTLERGYALIIKNQNTLIIHHLIDIVTRTYFLSHPYFEIKNKL